MTKDGKPIETNGITDSRPPMTGMKMGLAVLVLLLIVSLCGLFYTVSRQRRLP